MSGQEKNLQHLENGRNKEWSGFGDGEEEEGARETKNSCGHYRKEELMVEAWFTSRGC